MINRRGSRGAEPWCGDQLWQKTANSVEAEPSWKIHDGKFGLIDNGLTGNRKLITNKIIENQITIKAGRIVWDKEGYSYENYINTPSPSYSDIE